MFKWCGCNINDTQQHLHFSRSFSSRCPDQSSWSVSREWYFYFWALTLNLQNKYIVYTVVHLSAEIMSLDRLTGAAAAVNETLDSGHLPTSCVAALIPPLSGHRWSLGRSKMALLFSCHSNIGKLTSVILTSASPELQHQLGETSRGGGSAYFFHFWTTTQPKTVKL